MVDNHVTWNLLKRKKKKSGERNGSGSASEHQDHHYITSYYSTLTQPHSQVSSRFKSWESFQSLAI